MTDRVLILDFGSQVTQLIARRVRETGVYCEIVPFNHRRRAARPRSHPRASSSRAARPRCIERRHAARAGQAVFEMGVPVLGICYGEQTMCAQLGGRVEPSDHREFGRAFIEIDRPMRAVRRRVAAGRARAGLDEPWRPGRRAAARLPRGRRERGRALRRHRRRRAANSTACSSIPRWCTRRQARRCCSNFAHKIAGCSGDWTMAAFRDAGDRADPRAGRQGQGDLRPLRRRRFRGGRGAAARGDRRPADLHLRRHRPDAARTRRTEVVTLFRDHYNIPLVHRDAAELFLGKLDGVTDPGAEAQDHRRAPSSTCSTRRRTRSAAPNSWRKARSIPT